VQIAEVWQIRHQLISSQCQHCTKTACETTLVIDTRDQCDNGGDSQSQGISHSLVFALLLVFLNFTEAFTPSLRQPSVNLPLLPMHFTTNTTHGRRLGESFSAGHCSSGRHNNTKFNLNLSLTGNQIMWRLQNGEEQTIKEQRPTCNTCLFRAQLKSAFVRRTAPLTLY